MKTEKVYCTDCDFYKDSWFKNCDSCNHETNLECVGDYAQKKYRPIEHPSKINANNDCKNFKNKEQK